MSDADGLYVGLMSGTSLDGVSAAVVRFEMSPAGLTHELLSFDTFPYSDSQRDRLAAAMQGGSAAEYCALSFDLGDWLSEAARAAMQRAGLDRREVRAIASHGQTIWHSPRRATWQIGEAAVIAERTGIDVISDFRVRDVAAGGEGAPLVPVADAMLYHGRGGEWRLLQNIGGIGNVTVVPDDGDLSRVRAFDTGPGVVLIDQLVRKLFPGIGYDDGGMIARSGAARREVVATLLLDPYFAQSPPKSTGREYFGARFADSIQELMGASASSADIIATAVTFTADSIGDAIRRFVPKQGDLVVSGGGARNGALMDELQRAVHPRRVKLFDDLYYDGEAKEAVAFALLGYLHIARTPGSVTGATGARGPRVLGKLTPA